MFRHFFLFELRYFLRGWMVWIFLAVITLMLWGATSSDNVVVGGGIGNTNRNAPWVLQNFYAITAVLTLLMTTAFMNNAATRDFRFNASQMMFSLPISKQGYLWGRYLGAVLVAVIPTLGVSIGMLAAPLAPWADAERFAAFPWHAHWNSILTFAIPNTLFLAALLFAVAVWFRSTTVSFLFGLLLLTTLGIADVLSDDLSNETLAAMLDPFGARAFVLATKYWTVAERNTQSVSLTGLLLWNRLLWTSIGFGVLALVSWKVRLGEKVSRKQKPAAEDIDATALQPMAVPRKKASWSGNVALSQFLGTFRFELSSLVRNPVFVVILCAALLNCIVSLLFSTGEQFGNKTFLVTYRVINVIQGSTYAFLIAIVTFFAGQLVWRDTEERVDEIQDSLPIRDWLLYVAKFAALQVSLLAIMGTTILAGIVAQAATGYTRFQIGLYAEEVLVRDFSGILFLSVAAFFFHVLSPNKYVGYFAFVGYLIFDAFGWGAMDVATRMVDFGSRPSIAYSDFFGFQPDAPGWQWFTLYWALFCGLIAVLSILLYRRGRETAIKRRLRVAAQRFSGGLRVAAMLLLTAFVATAGWVYYNTQVLNELLSSDEIERRRADYEKQYKQYEKLAQPRITAVRYEIDLYPETRGVQMRGTATIRNQTAEAIPVIHFSIDNSHDTEIQLEAATLEKEDKPLRYRIYRLATPMQPGEERTLRFTVKGEQRGFPNSMTRAQFVQNGTFFNNRIAPQIGYDAGSELTDRNDRRKHGLDEKDLMPALERNCTANCANTYISSDADWVSVESVISTVPDQIAIAPGSLQREWQENGRRYFHYKLDRQSLNFYSFLSARYQVTRDQWNGVNIEIYHLPEHNWNVPRMVESVKKSLAYYTENFGPYYHKQARIIEFPRIASFAQAFPGTMPYSEGIGFIADLRDPESIDHVFYVVAHEMAHQWWAHQVIGANMQGATILSETLAQYSALMVMEKEYGRDQMRKFLEYERDQYLRARGTERLKERPLIQVEASQGYIHYQKGSVAMYYLKEMIGEDKVNVALRDLVNAFAYRNPPYPTAHELVDRLRAQTPPEYQYLIRDLFEEITLFSNRTIEAKAAKTSDGKYTVTVKADARKYKADEQGNETEVPVKDWIEVVAFAAPEQGKKFGNTLYRERLLVDKADFMHQFTVDALPAKAGIDGFHLLVDRLPGDNTVDVTLQ